MCCNGLGQVEDCSGPQNQLKRHTIYVAQVFTCHHNAIQLYIQQTQHYQEVHEYPRLVIHEAQPAAQLGRTAQFSIGFETQVSYSTTTFMIKIFRVLNLLNQN